MLVERHGRSQGCECASGDNGVDEICAWRIVYVLLKGVYESTSDSWWLQVRNVYTNGVYFQSLDLAKIKE